MEREHNNWPVVAGVTAGVFIGVAAALYYYLRKADDGSRTKLRDAKDIIAHCHGKIKEIEESLESLKHPIVA